MMIIGFVFLLTNIEYCRTIQRVYYIAVVEDIWNYAPNGNLIYTGDFRDTEIFLKLNASLPTSGTKYRKSLYRQFTDETFTKRVEAPEWQGMIGPVMRAEVGDTFVVHFQNRARFNYSIHPHGVFYNKDSEGAAYTDGTTGKDKLDEAVPPGHNYTYIWSARPEYGPTEDDPNCLTWLYHSHWQAEVEQMTGADGILVICKKGVLDSDGNRKDVDKDVALLFAVMDENFSQYYTENNKAAGITDEAINRNFPTFQMSNLKHSINGFIYGNLPGLDFCLGDKISLHIAALGNDEAHHPVYVQGQTMEILKSKTNAVGVFPGSSVTAVIHADNEGKWLLSSRSLNNIRGGMQAFFNVKNCNKTHKHFGETNRVTGKTRVYRIAAEEILWNYAPSGINEITGQSLTECAANSFGTTSDKCRLNGIYKKAVFKSYRDSNFKLPTKRTDEEKHLGYLGPVIRGEVGDVIKVLFYNRASRPYSIQTDRYYVTVDQQGTKFNGSEQVAVAPNKKRLYTWTVPPSVGPSKDDPDCLFGTYYSAVDQIRDIYSGLIGPLLVCKKNKLDHFEKNLEKHFYLIFENVQETQSHYWEDNVQRACGKNSDLSKLDNDQNMQMDNTMKSINGYVYGNLPGLEMTQGESIYWYVTSIGVAIDGQHAPYFHGNTFVSDGSRKDDVLLTPGLSKTLFMRPDNPGKWLIQDIVQAKGSGMGLAAFYTVRKTKNKINSNNGTHKVRTYYIGAVEEEWNFYPDISYNLISGERLDEDPASRPAYIRGDFTIGQIYKKALYKEFTDETFKTQKVRSERELHLGILGPIIKAEVGDTIKVVFKNFARLNFSIQPHGVFYNKSNEGQSYKDGTNSTKDNDAVAPGQIRIYNWGVPERAGPTDDDFPCIHWPYGSGVNIYKDLYAGLVGVIIICRPKTLDENANRVDVDREFVLFFNIYHEMDSPYFDENIMKFTNKPLEAMKMKKDHEFLEVNFKMAINGYSFNSIPHVDMYLGETSAFYLLSLGEIYQMHTIHWHGNTFIKKVSGHSHRHDVMDVLSAEYQQVEMLGVNTGEWLLHCHVNNHSVKGMVMTYRVIDPDQLDKTR